MTTDTDRTALVERLAREAGFGPLTGASYDESNAPGLDAYVREEYNVGAELERFAALVAAECARTVEAELLAPRNSGPLECAAAIRERFAVKEVA